MRSQGRYLTVSQLNEYVKMLMDSDAVLGDVWLRAEISNFKNHYQTGHFYFSLKDEGSLVRAVMFRAYAQKVAFAPADGMKVLVHGRVTSFVRDGQYQVYVDEILPEGTGALYLAFEQLKKKLAAEGLFDEARKRPLPKYPSRIGIVTSPTGAAIQDMMNILGRRFPLSEILLYPALVQGADAPPTLIAGLRHFAESQSVDVIIIGRGGGSAEDLWAFNDEALARAVAASPIPVISAVGHEVDFTICDFVADRRAPTPSSAAELAVPDAQDVKRHLQSSLEKLRSLSVARVEQARKSVTYLGGTSVLSDPAKLLEEKRMSVLFQSSRLDSAWEKGKMNACARLSEVSARLGALNPLAVLSRGYSVVTDADGAVVKSVDAVKKEDALTLRVSDGQIRAVVTACEKENENG